MRLQLEAFPGMRVEIDILDACGRVIRRLPSTCLNGQACVSWDGRGSDARLVRPGIYHIRLRSADQTLSRRVAIIR
jgi:flagellar hook assembly protein FlgD